MKHEIKYTEDILWLKPFTEKVRHLVPIHKISNIRGYKVQKDLRIQQDGSLILDGKTKKHSLNIRLYYFDKKNNKYIKDVYSTVLDTLAHELAHLKHWEHTPSHFRLQAKILFEFAYVLQDLGVKDTSRRFE